MEAVVEVSQRLVDPDDQEFIESLVSENHQEAYWKGWVVLYTKSNAASKKERILVVTNFRMYTVKLGVLKRSLRQSFSLMDLNEISSSDTNDKELHLEFNGTEIDIISDKIVEIAQALMFSFRSITYGWPAKRVPKMSLPARFTTGFISPTPDTQDGIIATYLAMCDYVQIPPKLPVLDYFMSSFEAGERVLELTECLQTVDKPSSQDILTIASALRYSDWFDELEAVDFPVKDDGLIHLSGVFHTKPISKCVLVNVKAGKAGFSNLCEVLSQGEHGLQYLNISKNNIGDSGIVAMMETLKKMEKPLNTLSFQACGFSAKGFKALVDAFRQPNWLTGLRVLDVSDNSAGKSGSQALADFIAESDGLEQFYAMRTELNVELFVESLVKNKRLSNNVLQTLNISGNKLTKKSVSILAEILKTSASLLHLYLVDTQLNKAMLLELLEAAINNPSDVRLWLEFSSNNIGDKGVQEVAELFNRYPSINTLHTLILSNNNINAEAVVALCKSLLAKNIHTLVIDCNIKTGMLSLSKAKEAGEAIAQFINLTPSLRELSIAGDDSHYMQSALFPVLEALKTANLQHLDVSRNRLGDEGIKLLCDALLVNTSLTSFNIERNRITLKGLHDLHAAIISNTSLIDWAIPMYDVETIVKSSPKTIHDVKSMLYDFESIMDRNYDKVREAESAMSVADAFESKDNVDSLAIPLHSERRASAYRRRGKRHSRMATDKLDMFVNDINKLVSDREDSTTTPERSVSEGKDENTQ